MNVSKSRTSARSRLLTLLMPTLSVLVIFGGWFFTAYLLKAKETRLLTKSGQLHVEDSGYSLRQTDTQKDLSDTSEEMETDDAQDFHGEAVSEIEMAKILEIWEDDSSLLSHEPQSGQMQMKQAITAASEWMTDLSEQGFFPSALSGDHKPNITAVLYTTEAKTDLSSHLLSRWLITYTFGSTRVSLTIHAASGQVWNAELYTDSDDLPIPVYLKDAQLLDAAFPFLEKDDYKIMRVPEHTSEIQLISSGGNLAASAHWALIATDQNEAYTILTLKLSSIRKSADGKSVSAG